ncbi:MAG: DNA polymerase IV [Treponema sp.]|nr:DNA polymerase IV [Treponema sp.]
MKKVYLHVDLDAFFASVEQLEHPEYRGKPVIVGGIPGDRRAVVSTASYEARKFGVHSAMPLVKAVALCPDGIFVRGNYHHYQEKSQAVMDIFSEYSPDVIQISVDEAFIDLTGTERLLGKPVDVARNLKNEVKEKTGLTVSVGIASTMYVAKICSGLNKPDGLTYVPEGNETEFMLSLPLEKLWGAGSKTLSRLYNAGLRSTKEIFSKSQALLISLFGDSTGRFLYESVRGNPGLEFGGEAKNHSISAETTYDFDLTERYAIDTALMELSINVSFRMRRENVRSRTVSLKIRYDDFTTVSIQSTQDRFIMSADDLFSRCQALFTKKWENGRGIRLLGVCCENVEDTSNPVQKELFDFGDEKKAKVEEAIYKMGNKNPGLAVTKARLLKK